MIGNDLRLLPMFLSCLMQGGFVEGSGVATASNNIIHEHFPSSLPPNSRLTFKITDTRECVANEVINDVANLSIGCIVQAGGY